MKNKIKILLLIAGTIIFNALFWKNSLGINASLFTLFLIGAAVFSFPQNAISKNSIAVIAGTLISGGAIMFHASIFSIIIWFLSLTLLPAFLHYNNQKTLFFGYITSIVDYFTIHKITGETIRVNKKTSVRLDKIIKYVKISFIPVLFLVLFYLIFKKANPVFEQISTDFFINIGNFLRNIFIDFSFLEIIFTIWGFTIILWFLYKRINNKKKNFEDNYSDLVTRKRSLLPKKGIYSATKGLKPGLKNEYIAGIILISMINILLLIVNIIDFNWVWIGFEYSQDFDLKQFVHEGTYLLILSILISIAIMIYFFRANLNFYPGVKNLRIIAYIWIAQNVFLTASVAIRNLHYIDYFGLAYKRIGVFFFLALVILGLITLFFKIKKQHSTFKMIKLNSWAVYIGFVLFAVPDWDVIIAQKNLSHPLKNNIETSYLLTLDDKVLPLIDARKDILLQSKEYNTYRYFHESYQEVYEQRVEDFIRNYNKKNKISRNFADDKAFEFYKNNYPELFKVFTQPKIEKAKKSKK